MGGFFEFGGFTDGGFYNVLATYPVTLGAGESASIVINADGTESVGANLVTDGDMSVAGSWNVAGGCTVAGGVGAYSGVGTSYWAQTTSFTAGLKYRWTFTVDANSKMVLANQAASDLVGTGQTTYTTGTHSIDFTAITSGTGLRVYAYATGGAFNIDNISIHQVTNPKQNGITCTISRATNRCTLSKTVAGTTTVLIDEAFTYGAGQSLVVSKDSDNKVNVTYNGGAIGTEQTVSDVTVIFNKRHYVTGEGTGTLTVVRQ